jgi:hypothetical protein
VTTDQDDASAEAGATSAGIGSAAEEAMRLVEALRDLVNGPGSEHLATGSAECAVCPFCRLVSLLREADPQTVTRAADGVVGAVAGIAAVAEPLLRSLVDTAVTAAQAAAAGTSPTTEDETP